MQFDHACASHSEAATAAWEGRRQMEVRFKNMLKWSPATFKTEPLVERPRGSEVVVRSLKFLLGQLRVQRLLSPNFSVADS